MRQLHTIVIHCTAAREGSGQTVADVRRVHIKRGWSDIGYHFLVDDDGQPQVGRPLDRVGAHARGLNRGSVGIAYTGGLAASGVGLSGPNREQAQGLRFLVDSLQMIFPTITRVIGHRDVPAKKDCPCFDVEQWLKTGKVVVSRNMG